MELKLKRKLGLVLLIDDDEPTSFLNEFIIKKLGITERVFSVMNGQKAIEFLTELKSNGDCLPDLIFLDINMPRMNGWEFLTEYEKLGCVNEECSVVILTTSTNPEDKERAGQIKSVSGFIGKPLTNESLRNLLKEHFPQLLEI